MPRVYLGVDLGVDACLPQRLLFPSVSIGQTYGGAQPLWTDLDNKLEIRDDLSKQIGRHAVKLGGRYIFMPVFGGIFGSPSPGYLYLSDDPSVIVSNSNGLYPQGFSTPGAVRLINIVSQTVGDYSSAEQSLHNGGPTNCQRRFHTPVRQKRLGLARISTSALTSRTTIRLSPKLTINAGVRFDTYNYIGSTSHLETNRFLQLLKQIGSPYGSGIPSTSKEVSPRLGTAWDVTGDGKHVVRATWGLFYLQALQEAMYTRNFFQQDVLLTTNTVAGPPLANFVYGQTPLPAPPLAPTTLPPGRIDHGLYLRSEPEGPVYLPNALRILAIVPETDRARRRLHQHARTERLAGAEHQPADRWRAPAAGRDAAVLRRSESHRPGERDGVGQQIAVRRVHRAFREPHLARRPASRSTTRSAGRGETRGSATATIRSASTRKWRQRRAGCTTLRGNPDRRRSTSAIA